MPRMPVEQYDPMGNATGLAVEAPAASPVQEPSAFGGNIDKIINSLFRTDEKRLQLWPERLVRDAIAAPHDVMTGKISRWSVDPETGELRTSPEMIKAGMDVSALAGTGGLGGTGAEAGMALGAGPSLRPALKYKDKIYKGKEGQQHLDVLPPNLVDEFQRMAMSGEDISHYNFGFMNHKGQFLDREAALKYAIDEGMLHPNSEAARAGVLTSTMDLMADSSKPAAAIKAMENAQPFFSTLEETVAKVGQSKMTGEQWLGTISNKPGVKPDELQYTGLKDFLETNKGQSVSKADIEKHLAENAFKLGETWKGSASLDKTSKYYDKDLERVLNSDSRGTFDDMHLTLSNDAKAYQSLMRKHPELKADDDWASTVLNSVVKGGGDTKYHSYQLPGGENYRELLLTAPNKLNEFRAAQNKNSERIKELRDSMHGTSGTNEIRAEIRRLHNENTAIQKQISDEPLYKSSHWDEPNILAHVRMNDRTVGDKKSLHLEEIQSDWHQQGRDRGYKGPPIDTTVLNDAVSSTRLAHSKAIDDSWKKFSNGKASNYREARDLLPEEAAIIKNEVEKYQLHNPEFKKIEQASIDAQEALSAANKKNSTGVPDAPFKKNWHELALKRAVREAAEKGYDRISWTPGEAQAARYDLSKTIDTVVYKGGKLQAFQKGRQVIDQSVEESRLADYIGKEGAEKLMKQPEKNGARALQGEELKVGGEGMKGFYDQIIPKAIEKITGQKVQKESVNNPFIALPGRNGKWDVNHEAANRHMRTFDTKQEALDYIKGRGTAVHYIDIPPSLKETAMKKGFPLFSDGPGWIIKNGELERE